jgi:hypothetical protein
MTNKIIDANKLIDWVDNHIFDAHLVNIGVDTLKKKINELSTTALANNPQKQAIIDFYVAFKDTIEVELAKPLEDSLLGITADNAYIAGLKTALRLADESAKYVIDKTATAPQENKSMSDWGMTNFNAVSFVRFLREKSDIYNGKFTPSEISTLILRLQSKMQKESIFDTDDWNNNFDQAPQDYDTQFLIKYYCDWKKCERVTVGHYEEAIEDYSHEAGFYT